MQGLSHWSSATAMATQVLFGDWGCSIPLEHSFWIVFQDIAFTLVRSKSLPFMMKVMVSLSVSDTHQVMNTFLVGMFMFVRWDVLPT